MCNDIAIASFVTRKSQKRTMKIHASAVVLMSLNPSSARAFSSVSRIAGRRSPVRSSRFPLAMISTSTDTTNPMLQQEGLPKFASIEPSNLTPAIETLLADLDQGFTNFESKLPSSSSDFDDILPAIEKLQHPLGYVWGIAGHLNGVKNGDELRKAYEENQAGVVQAMTKFSQSKPLFDALSKLEKDLKGDEFEDMQQRRAVEQSLRSMKLGGVGLEGEQKEKFNKMKMKLAELSTSFGNHVMDATKAFSLTIDDPAELGESVPESAKAMWSNSHVMHLKSQGDECGDVDPSVGPYRITLDAPSYIATLSHVPDRAVREKVYRAFLTRASEFSGEGLNNIPLIYEILELKQAMSKMLGYANYSEQSLSTKMAPSVDAVGKLTDLIAEKALPAAQRELAEITALAREQGGDEYSEANIEKLMPWDTTFWSERLKESRFDLTQEELRPYFALPAVLHGMFGLVERLFDIQVRAADGEAEVWHPDVRFFNVYDASSEKQIASYFLDPYSRPENKRGGAWMDVCAGKSEAMKCSIPVAYLTCNGSPPVGDTPSLMTFQEVETLFHEFGHGLQHMLTRANVGDVAGINGVEWDAVELPSQFMENWCYDRPTIFGFAKHYETGEPLPEEMFEKLKEQKTYGAGMMSCRQLLFGQLDLELHANFDAKAGTNGDGESIFDVHRRIAEKYTPYSMPLEEDRFLCAFSHIFGGGYAAGYYSYKWAEVMSADAFGAFEDVGLDNEAEVKRVGMKFRDTVLSLGGGVPPTEVFSRFRGRDPTPDALLRHNDLA